MKGVYWGVVIVGVVTALACTQQANSSQEEQSVQPKVKVKQQPVSQKAQVREVSELAGIMLQMHDQIKEIKVYIKNGEPIPDSLIANYERMKTAQVTKDMHLDENFDGMATAFLSDLSKAMDDQGISTYNEAINSCVACHSNYCPGPISRIKKLKI